MTANYVASVDGVLLRVGDRIVPLYRDGGVPAGADEGHVKLLLDRGLLVASEPDDVDGDGPVPAKSADKATWVDFAVSKGATQADAEALTKDQLIEQYGAA